MKNSKAAAILAMAGCSVFAVGCAGVPQAPRDTTATGALTVQNRTDKDNTRAGMVDDDGSTTTHIAAASRSRGRSPSRTTRAASERPPRGPHQ